MPLNEAEPYFSVMLCFTIFTDLDHNLAFVYASQIGA